LYLRPRRACFFSFSRSPPNRFFFLLERIIPENFSHNSVFPSERKKLAPTSSPEFPHCSFLFFSSAASSKVRRKARPDVTLLSLSCFFLQPAPLLSLETLLHQGGCFARDSRRGPSPSGFPPSPPLLRSTPSSVFSCGIRLRALCRVSYGSSLREVPRRLRQADLN